MLSFFFSADLLREMILTFQNECIQSIVPVLGQAHNNFQESHIPGLFVAFTDTPTRGLVNLRTGRLADSEF